MMRPSNQYMAYQVITKRNKVCRVLTISDHQTDSSFPPLSPIPTMPLMHKNALCEDPDLLQLFENLNLQAAPSPQPRLRENGDRPVIEIFSSDEEEEENPEASTTGRPAGVRFPTNKEPRIEFNEADRQLSRAQLRNLPSVESLDEYPDSDVERSIANVDVQSLERHFQRMFHLVSTFILLTLPQPLRPSQSTTYLLVWRRVP